MKRRYAYINGEWQEVESDEPDEGKRRFILIDGEWVEDES